MNALELKSDLHQLIDSANDLNILQAIKIILSKDSIKQMDWADSIDNSLKEELEISINEADEGKTMSHTHAMQQIHRRYQL